jgi:phosphatidylserine/phosphatidylglycerophosphate/cardiolipin synthase-like enzyme
MRNVVAGLAFAVAGFVACGGSTSNTVAPGDAGTEAGGSSSGGSSGSSSGGDAGTHDSGGSSGGSSGSSSGGSSSGLSWTSAVSIIVEPSDDAQGLISAIEGAKTSVHMEMYLLSNSDVINALIARHQAGVDVKVILNKTFPSTGSNAGSNASVYSQLQSAGVSVVWAPAGFTYTHEKGVIIDAATAWIMTMNATESSPTSNREYLAVDTDATDVAEAEAIFEHDYADQSYTPKGKLVVSPTNSRTDLTALIGMATKSIDMEAEELTDTGIVGALETAAMRGVAVHVVMADATTTTSAPALKTAGVKLVVYTNYYVHAKSIVVDGAYAYVGSENFSAGSLGYNRELGVLTDTASEVAKVATTTASDFAAGTPQ